MARARAADPADAVAGATAVAALLASLLVPGAALALWVAASVGAAAGTLRLVAPLAGVFLPLPLGQRAAVMLAGIASWCVAGAAERRVETIERRGLTDDLTGVYTRAFLAEAVSHALSASERTARAVSLLVLDLDRFKRFNDTHGHAAGDDLLRAVGAVLRREVRTSDVAARLGGEEFVVLVDGDDGDALRLGERLRLAIAATVIPVPGGEASTTISAGVAQALRGDDGRTLFEAADAALYRAKEGGRDRVVVARRRGVPRRAAA